MINSLKNSTFKTLKHVCQDLACKWVNDFGTEGETTYTVVVMIIDVCIWVSVIDFLLVVYSVTIIVIIICIVDTIVIVILRVGILIIRNTIVVVIEV